MNHWKGEKVTEIFKDHSYPIMKLISQQVNLCMYCEAETKTAFVGIAICDNFKCKSQAVNNLNWAGVGKRYDATNSEKDRLTGRILYR